MQANATVFPVENNSLVQYNGKAYDVFVGRGYENHVRIVWDFQNKKWESVLGNNALLSKAVQIFNREMKGK